MNRPNRLVASVLLCLLLVGNHLHAQTPPPSDPQAAAHRAQGKTLASQGDDAGAIAEYEQALARDQETHIADATLDLYRMGNCYLRTGQYAEALTTFERELALERQIGDKEGEAATLNNLGATQWNLSRYDQALAFYRQALPILRQLGDKEGEATTLHNIGSTYSDLGRYAEALTFYRQALPLRRLVGDKTGEAATLNGIGLVYSRQGRYRQALDIFERALVGRRQSQDQLGEAVTLSNIGQVYDGLSRFREALDFYQQALEIQRRRGNARGEATTLNNIGAAFGALSQYAQALDAYAQALAGRRAVGDRAGEAVTLNNTGTVYDRLGQYSKALNSYRQALALRRETGDRAGEATTLNNMGAALTAQGRNAPALDSYRQALAIQQQIGDRAGEAASLHNVGRAHENLGHRGEALDAYRQALRLERQLGDAQGQAVTLNSLGAIYDASGDHARALEFYGQALAGRRRASDTAGEAVTLNNLMRTWAKMGRPNLAVFYGKQAVNAYQSIRANISALDAAGQRTYLSANEDTYRTLAALLIDQGRLPEAQQVLKLLKEREFFDFLNPDAHLPSSALNSVALTQREAVWTDAYRKAARSQTALSGVQKRIAAAFAGPPTADDAPPRTTGARDVQRALRPGMAALYTIVAPDKLILILITPHTQKAYTSKITSDALYDTVFALRRALTDPRLDPTGPAAALYQSVLGPVQKDLDAAHVTTLLFSLDDALRYVPPAALYNPKTKQYLAERYQSEMITLTGAPPTARAAKPLSMLGLGVTASLGGAPALPGVRAELESLIREPSDAGGLLPGRRLLDAQFTQSALEARLKAGSYPLVHLASHFSLHGTQDASYLLLGDGTHLSVAEIARNARLFRGVNLLTLSACDTAMEVRSSSGKEVEGFGALAQQLGARSVVASLWPVSDAATPLWMQAFYDTQKRHPSVSLRQAVRQAQLSLLHGHVTAGPSKATKRAGRAVEDEEDVPAHLARFQINLQAPYAHPYYWAPFVLIGNWR